MTDNFTSAPARAPQRVRHDIRRRDLKVTGIEDLTPHMRRVTLTGDMTGFQSLGFDDHVKLLFPDPDTGIIAMPGGDAKPVMRDYTPRGFDVNAGTLTLDFALHGVAEGTAGPATAWAAAAKPGDHLVVAGPRGSMVWPLDFALHLLIGDDTALPAIGRRLAELPAGAKAIVLLSVDGPEDHLELSTAANAAIHWTFRSPDHGGHRLSDAVAGLRLTEPDIFVWVGTEAEEARAIRDVLETHHKIDPQRIKASGYWQRETA